MKTRDSEASRLEGDYLARVRSALAGNAPWETDEIIQSIQEHIEEELTEKAADVVGLAQMAAVLERLGPPEAYAQALREPAEAPPAPPPGELDFGGCWNDAIGVYKRNVGRLIVMAALWLLLSICSALILLGPLMGGATYAMLLAMRRPSKKVAIGDMFACFRRFWTLLGTSVIQVLPAVIGYALVAALILPFVPRERSIQVAVCYLVLIPPGLLLSAIWLYVELLVLDKNEGVFGSLGRSCSVAKANGFWVSLGIAAMITLFELAATVIPYAAIPLGLVLSPLGWLLAAAAYNRCRLDVT